jgi:predicted exporter
MRRLRRRLSPLLWTAIVLVLVGTVSGLAIWLAPGPEGWKGLALYLAAGLVGAAVTAIVLVLILERQESDEAEKERLIAELGSHINDVAVAAAEKLRRGRRLNLAHWRDVEKTRASMRTPCVYARPSSVGS